MAWKGLSGCHIKRDSGVFQSAIPHFLILFIKVLTISFSSSFKPSHNRRSSFCSSDRFGMLSLFVKNWAMVIPNAAQILSIVTRVGTFFFFTISDSADCEIPVRLDSWYLVIPPFEQSSSILIGT